MTAPAIAPEAVLRDGEVPFDHGAENAPEHGPLTAGADMLTALTYNQLCCLITRMSVVREDYSALRFGEDRHDLPAARVADLDATWDEATGLLYDSFAARDVVLRRDGAR